MISRPIRVDRAINFFADKIGPSVFCVPSEGAAERERGSETGTRNVSLQPGSLPGRI